MAALLHAAVLGLAATGLAPAAPPGDAPAAPPCTPPDPAASAGLDDQALALVPCLANPDPRIRDGLAFEGLSALLRGRQLSGAGVERLRQALLAGLALPPDDAGVRRPFMILALAEVARADRLQPQFDAARREALVAAAAGYLRDITDHRGFVDGEGWRHGVAHGADLVMQLALNPAVDRSQLERLLDALQGQVSPAGGHAYIHGEPERLARAVVLAHGRGLLPAEWWEGWFRRLADPAPLGGWGEAWRSEVGLARLHNTKAFLAAVGLASSEARAPGTGLARLTATTRVALEAN